MTRRISVWLLVSVVAHVALVVAALVVLRFVPAPVLFVDLVHDLLTAVELGQALEKYNTIPQIE